MDRPPRPRRDIGSRAPFSNRADRLFPASVRGKKFNNGASGAADRAQGLTPLPKRGGVCITPPWPGPRPRLVIATLVDPIGRGCLCWDTYGDGLPVAGLPV